MKIMISQPMNGITESEILATRDRFLSYAKENNLEVVNTLFTDEWYSMEKRKIEQKPVYFIAKSIEGMSLCNIVYFAKGWEDARGCVIEHRIATAYGMEIIYE